MIQKLPGVELEVLESNGDATSAFVLDERFITNEVAHS